MTPPTKQTVKVPAINVWSRLGHVWANPNFLQNILCAEKNAATGRTWAFWFIWNSLIALVLSIVLIVWGRGYVEDFEAEIKVQMPEFTASVIDGKFSTDLPQPYVIKAFKNEGILLAIDTEGTTYNRESLKDYEEGLVVTADEFIGRKSNGQYESFSFSDFEEDVAFTRTDLINGWEKTKPKITVFVYLLIYLGLWLWLCVWRLLTAVWWALVAWGIGVFLGLPEWSFGKSYLAVLNFYIIPLIFEILLIFVGVGLFAYSTSLVFALVFGVNFWQFKKHIKAA